MPAIIDCLDACNWMVWLSVTLEQVSFIPFPFQMVCWKDIQALLIHPTKKFWTMAYAEIMPVKFL